MNSSTFTLSGTWTQVSSLVLGIFEKRGFRISAAGDETSIAERGSQVGNAFGGAFAQYFKFGFSITVVGDNSVKVQVTQLTSGMMGGFIGMARTRKAFRELNSELHDSFVAAGVFSSQDPS